LQGTEILIVEDDYFAAAELQQNLEDVGADVVGPFSTAAQAQDLLRRRKRGVSAAVLDINIAGSMIFPLAEMLRDANIPFVFATGYDGRAIPAEFQTVPRLLKPVEKRLLLHSLVNVLQS
jgi:DNA-binding LytR/AlgR family response regulator